MRPGEIVRSGTRITTFEKLPTGCDGEPWAGCRIVTVAELFKAAGYPIPGDRLYWLSEWYSSSPCGYESVWCDDGWLTDEHLRQCDPLIDLSRLPALDAWGSIPQIIKAVVR